jgi:hypothetical protein
MRMPRLDTNSFALRLTWRMSSYIHADQNPGVSSSGGKSCDSYGRCHEIGHSRRKREKTASRSANDWAQKSRAEMS